MQRSDVSIHRHAILSPLHYNVPDSVLTMQMMLNYLLDGLDVIVADAMRTSCGEDVDPGAVSMSGDEVDVLPSTLVEDLAQVACDVQDKKEEKLDDGMVSPLRSSTDVGLVRTLSAVDRAKQAADEEKASKLEEAKERGRAKVQAAWEAKRKTDAEAEVQIKSPLIRLNCNVIFIWKALAILESAIPEEAPKSPTSPKSPGAAARPELLSILDEDGKLNPHWRRPKTKEERRVAEFRSSNGQF